MNGNSCTDVDAFNEQNLNPIPSEIKCLPHQTITRTLQLLQCVCHMYVHTIEILSLVY